jgi:hypothetical protein
MYAYTTKNIQTSILFADSAIGMWQQLSKNRKDNSQIGEHLTGKCFHAYLWEEVEFPNPTECPIQQTVDKKQVILEITDRESNNNLKCLYNISMNACMMNEGTENS